MPVTPFHLGPGVAIKAPFAPLSANNGLLYVITIDELHTACLALGLFGVTVLLIVALAAGGR